MWNKIFKHKSSKSSSGSHKEKKNGDCIVKDEVSDGMCGSSSAGGCDIPVSVSVPSTPVSNSTKSKFSKVVNSFSLKRGPKENRNAVTIVENNCGFLENATTNGGRCGTLKRGFIDDQARIVVSTDHDKLNELLIMDNGIPSQPIDLELKPCPICGRTFVPDTLKKHVNICEKMQTKKRKIFDSSKQRREGTDLADYLPIGFGLPEIKKSNLYQEQKCTAKTTQQSSNSSISQKQNDSLSRESSTVSSITNTQKKSLGSIAPQVTSTPIPAAKETPKPKAERKRGLLPPSEPCPYCERCFGIKAYDRHVEWCKEKTRLIATHKNTAKNVAKERLEARIKYRAPCLKSKRAANREKYSGLSCDDSVSIADSFDGNNSKTNQDDHRKLSMSTSLSSSIMSESGISDKYDPFLSAKRQLEELCSPTSIEPPITPITPTTPNPKTNKLPSNLSSSYTANHSNPSNTSNFRRTSSLRVSRKKTTPTHHHSSRPLFYPQSKDRPTIQRGISDEGPISSCFLKPEEYDEMPVKSACVNDLAISHHHHHYVHHSPKVVKRDANSSVNRRNLRLNLNNNKTMNNNKSSTNLRNNPISKTDSLAIFLKYENEAKHNSPVTDNANTPSPSSSTKLSEKDLKDKTNTTLSKHQTLSSTGPSNKLSPSLNPIENKNNFNIDNSNNRFKEINSVMTINKIHPIKLEPLPSKIISLNSANLPNENTNLNSRQSIQKPSQPQSLNLSSILDSKDSTDFIDPKLINICDNLPINITKISDSDFTSSSTDSVSTTKFTNLETTATNNIQQQQQQQQQQQHQNNQQQTPPSSNRSSSERRNLLKRQLRLGKNQFLYDMSPEDDDDVVIIDSYSDECDKTISLIDTNDNNNHRFNNNNHLSTKVINNDETPTFDDFDFEEFLSSFDENDEEQYPIFKDYKKFLMMNRSLNKQYHEQQQQQQQQQQTIDNQNHNNNNFNNNSIRSTSITEINHKDDEVEEFCDDDIDIESRKNEIFISIETNQNEEIINSNPSLIPLSPSPQHPDSDINYHDVGVLEKDEDKKSDQITKQFIDSNRNTKNFIEQIEKINDDDFNSTTNNIKDKNQSSDHMMYEMQDSDEISSSVDENFPANDRNGNIRSKPNADSAYGSLSRHSPIDPMIRRNSSRARQQQSTISTITNMMPVDQSSPILKPKYSTSSLWMDNKRRSRNFSASSSSSSSDNSLPLSSALIQSQKDRDSKLQDQQEQQQSSNGKKFDAKMSKFCHECGSKFILTQAKFCMECGVKRIILE